MFISRAARLVLAIVIVSLAACAPMAKPVSNSAPLKVYLLSDGNCEVKAKKLPCGEAPLYMRDVLKLHDTSQFVVISRGTPGSEVMMAFFEALGHAGFKGKYGIVDTADIKE